MNLEKNYEFGIYKDGKLIELFRTDTDYVLKAIQSEAEKYAGWLRDENPNTHYEVRKIRDSTLKPGSGWWVCGN